MKHKNIDISRGNPVSDLPRFALPIALSGMLQQLFNSADTVVVGKFADRNALAAVGTNGELVAFLVCISAGLAVGVNVLLASFIGSNKRERISPSLHSALLFAFSVGVVLAAVGQIISAPVLRLIDTPAEIIDDAAVYLRIYFAGLPSLMLYDFGAAALRSEGDSRRPFIILTLSGVLNVILNLFFVTVLKMTVSGVAAATVIANTLAAVGVLYLLGREKDEFHFSLRKLRFDAKSIKSVVRIGVPAALQSAVFCFANIFVQTAINGFGTVAIDGSTIAMNYEYFTYYMVTAFGQTATTFISRNYSAKEYDRCTKILRLCLLYSMVSCAAMTVPIVIFRGFFCSVFSSDAEVIAAASQRMMMILALEPLCGLYEIPADCLRGMGESAKPAFATITGTCIFRLIWIQTVFRRYATLTVLFAVFPISWFITICGMWAILLRLLRKMGK